MNLVSKKNARPLFNLQNEINSVFDDFFGNRFDMETLSKTKWPTLEIKEDEKEYKVKAEIPGLAEEDINLVISDNTLEISGERKDEKEEEKNGTSYSEMSYGSFYRTIPFECEVDTEKVKAKMKDGILKVTVAKADNANTKRRKIEISR